MVFCTIYSRIVFHSKKFSQKNMSIITICTRHDNFMTKITIFFNKNSI